MIEEVVQVLSWHKLTHTGSTSWHNPHFLSNQEFEDYFGLLVFQFCVQKTFKCILEMKLQSSQGLESLLPWLRWGHIEQRRCILDVFVSIWWWYLALNENLLQMVVYILPQIQTTLCFLLELGIHEDSCCQDSESSPCITSTLTFNSLLRFWVGV